MNQLHPDRRRASQTLEWHCGTRLGRSPAAARRSVPTVRATDGGDGHGPLTGARHRLWNGQHYARHCPSSRHAGPMHGIDISEPMLSLARARAERANSAATFICANAREPRFRAGEFRPAGLTLWRDVLRGSRSSLHEPAARDEKWRRDARHRVARRCRQSLHDDGGTRCRPVADESFPLERLTGRGNLRSRIAAASSTFSGKWLGRHRHPTHRRALRTAGAGTDALLHTARPSRLDSAQRR